MIRFTIGDLTVNYPSGKGLAEVFRVWRVVAECDTDEEVRQVKLALASQQVIYRRTAPKGD